MFKLKSREPLGKMPSIELPRLGKRLGLGIEFGSYFPRGLVKDVKVDKVFYSDSKFLSKHSDPLILAQIKGEYIGL